VGLGPFAHTIIKLRNTVKHFLILFSVASRIVSPALSTSLPDREAEICRRLRSFREQTKISRTAFALSIGVGGERLASYESARAPIRYEMFLTIAKRYPINPVWLATGFGSASLRDAFDFAALPMQIPYHPRALFSDVYDTHLKPILENKSIIADRKLQQAEHALDDLNKWARENAGFKIVPARREWIYRALAETVATINSADSSEGERAPQFLLTEPSHSGKVAGVTLKSLLARLDRITKTPGAKAKLAKFLKAPRESVSRWLSGDREPGGKITLKMLEWVEQEERK
jgi:transcriptional regulator with XRE-family HTH domain